MERIIQIRGPEAFFPVLSDDALPIREAGRWTIENQRSATGYRLVKYRAEFSPEDSPAYWPFSVEWQSTATVFSREFTYREVIEFDVLLARTERVFETAAEFDETVLTSLMREWKHVCDEMSRRMAGRNLLNTAIPVSVKLSTPEELTSISGPGSYLGGKSARWTFECSLGQPQELVAWRRSWGWASWLSFAVIVIVGGVAVIRTYRRWLRRVAYRHSLETEADEYHE